MSKHEIEVTPIASPELIHSVIQRVATGPELSKNISYDEARSMMNALLSGSIDPVQAAVFLIGLRMKRETDTELQGILDALYENTSQVAANCDEVVAFSDPFNGFNRTIPGSLAMLPVLAACGINGYLTGVDQVGPKYGVTHHLILQALGGNPLQTMQTVAERLSEPTIGWGYADQSVYCKPLYQLVDLRAKIVKRPALSTTEVMITPITGEAKTHLVSGYVHKPYRQIYAMLAKHRGLDSLLLIRGTEGGVIPSFRAKAHFVRYIDNKDAEEHDADLEPLQLFRSYRAEDIPDSTPKALAPKYHGTQWDNKALAAYCGQQIINALNGEQGAAYDAAVLGTALTLWHAGKSPTLIEATTNARNAIASGEALERFNNGLNAT